MLAKLELEAQGIWKDKTDRSTIVNLLANTVCKGTREIVKVKFPTFLYV